MSVRHDMACVVCEVQASGSAIWSSDIGVQGTGMECR